MEGIRARARARSAEPAPARPATRPTAPEGRSAARRLRWLFRACACLIALAQHTTACPPAALLAYRALERDEE